MRHIQQDHDWGQGRLTTILTKKVNGARDKTNVDLIETVYPKHMKTKKNHFLCTPNVWNRNEWMTEWTDTSLRYRHWRMCFERLLQAFARWQPGNLFDIAAQPILEYRELIVIHNSTWSNDLDQQEFFNICEHESRIKRATWFDSTVDFHKENNYWVVCNMRPAHIPILEWKVDMSGGWRNIMASGDIWWHLVLEFEWIGLTDLTWGQCCIVEHCETSDEYKPNKPPSNIWIRDQTVSFRVNSLYIATFWFDEILP